MRGQYDGTVVRFDPSPGAPPAPPRALLYEHFKQAVLANMRGAGQPRDLEFDPSGDAHAMSTFEDGEGKEWLQQRLMNKLAHLQVETLDAETLRGEGNSSP
jgi:hypothetical protein